MDACGMTEAPSAACEAQTASAEARMVRVKEFMVGAVMHGNEAADLKSSFGLGHRMIGEAATVYDASENDVARLWPDSPGPEDPNRARLERPVSGGNQEGRQWRWKSRLLKPASWQAVQISIESERTPRQSCSLVYTAAQAGKIFRMKLDKHHKMW